MKQTTTDEKKEGRNCKRFPLLCSYTNIYKKKRLVEGSEGGIWRKINIGR